MQALRSAASLAPTSRQPAAGAPRPVVGARRVAAPARRAAPAGGRRVTAMAAKSEWWEG